VLQLLHVLRKGVGIVLMVAPECAGRQLVGAGRAAQAQVDAAGVERSQRSELLGNHQRCMVGQHDTA
jgi:hypothetical protein